MARVYRHKGAYWIDFLDADGVRHRKKAGPTKRIATELLHDTLGKVVRQEHLGLLDSKVAFSDYATGWVERMRTTVKPRSYEQYEAITRLHLVPAFPGSLKAISLRQVEAYVAKRLDEGAKPSTVNVSLAVLKAIVRAAVRERHLARNPLDGLKPIKAPAGRVRFLSHDEITTLLDACAATPADARVPGAYLKPFVLFALNTGMRRNEVAFLARRHVDWTARVATLTDTKSGKPRLVPLNEAAIAALKAVPPRLDTDRFFPFAPLDLTRAFGRAVDSAGITDFHLHDCRHTFASWQSMAGVTPRGLQELLGHADGRMTMRYSHLSDAYLRAAVDRVQLGTGAPIDSESGTHLAPDAVGVPNAASNQEDAPAQNRTGT